MLEKKWWTEAKENLISLPVLLGHSKPHKYDKYWIRVYSVGIQKTWKSQTHNILTEELSIPTEQGKGWVLPNNPCTWKVFTLAQESFNSTFKKSFHDNLQLTVNQWITKAAIFSITFLSCLSTISSYILEALLITRLYTIILHLQL
jgi:hypothetical protein